MRIFNRDLKGEKSKFSLSLKFPESSRMLLNERKRNPDNNLTPALIGLRTTGLTFFPPFFFPTVKMWVTDNAK